ncbi:hypothetical protein DMENIID0001_094790 [Sergentomyia squamirostris]
MVTVYTYSDATAYGSYGGIGHHTALESQSVYSLIYHIVFTGSLSNNYGVEHTYIRGQVIPCSHIEEMLIPQFHTPHRPISITRENRYANSAFTVEQSIWLEGVDGSQRSWLIRFR